LIEFVTVTNTQMIICCTLKLDDSWLLLQINHRFLHSSCLTRVIITENYIYVYAPFVCYMVKGVGMTSFVCSSAWTFYGIRCNPKASHICSCLSFALRVTEMWQGMERF